MAENCLKLLKRSSHSAHTNPMESGPRNTFSTQNQKNQRFVILDPKKAPPPPPQRGVPTKKSLGEVFWGGGGVGDVVFSHVRLYGFDLTTSTR